MVDTPEEFGLGGGQAGRDGYALLMDLFGVHGWVLVGQFSDVGSDVVVAFISNTWVGVFGEVSNGA